MRRHLLPLALLAIVLAAAVSVAYSYYNETRRTVINGEEISEESPGATEETPWEQLTKKLVGVVNL